MNRFETRNAFLFRLAALLLLGVLLTMRLFTALPARYSSNASDSDDVDIALQAIAATEQTGTTKFEFKVNGNNTLGTYQFKVTNKTAQGVCEVSMKYSVMISLPDPLVLEACTIKFDGTKLVPGSANASNGNKDYTFACSKTFTAGNWEVGPEHKVTVEFIDSYLPSDSYNYVDVNSNFYIPSGGLTEDQKQELQSVGSAIFYSNNIKIYIISEQID